MHGTIYGLPLDTKMGNKVVGLKNLLNQMGEIAHSNWSLDPPNYVSKALNGVETLVTADRRKIDESGWDELLPALLAASNPDAEAYRKRLNEALAAVAESRRHDFLSDETADLLLREILAAHLMYRMRDKFPFPNRQRKARGLFGYSRSVNSLAAPMM